MGEGQHSLKTGYEFQYVMTEVQDVNPLYGRDAYTGNFTRPTGVAANNLYNLADFMLGLRSQYALSSILIANLRQRYQFAYVQDDFRRERQADAEPRPALRVRDAVLGEGQPDDQLRPGREDDDLRQGRVDVRPGAHRPGSQQLGARASGSRTA